MDTIQDLRNAVYAQPVKVEEPTVKLYAMVGDERQKYIESLKAEALREQTTITMRNSDK